MSTPDRHAVTDAHLTPLLAARWSPRGFDTAHVLSDGDLHTLLEAARWAPSCANSQPWRFLLGRRGDEVFGSIAVHLAEGNQKWAPTASALLIAAATVVDGEGKSLQPWATYDTGQAIAHPSVQAGALDLAVHQMAGFDAAGIAKEFGLAEAIEPLTAVAIGRFDPAADLPGYLKTREFAPRERRPVADLLL